MIYFQKHFSFGARAYVWCVCVSWTLNSYNKQLEKNYKYNNNKNLSVFLMNFIRFDCKCLMQNVLSHWHGVFFFIPFGLSINVGEVFFSFYLISLYVFILLLSIVWSICFSSLFIWPLLFFLSPCLFSLYLLSLYVFVLNFYHWLSSAVCILVDGFFSLCINHIFYL